MGVDSVLQRLEALNDKVLLSVLSSECKDIENDFPSRLYKLGLLVTECCHAHDNIFLYFFLARVKIIQHYCFEWFQKHFLIAEILSLLFFQEFIRQLPQRINSVDHDVQILARTHPCEMLPKSSPNTLPLETNTVHVQRGYLDQLLKAELLWAVFIGKLLFRDPAKIFDEVDNCISVKSLTLEEDSFDLICVNLLSDDGRVTQEELLVQGLTLAGCAGLAFEVLRVCEITKAQDAHMIDLGDAFEHVRPAVSQAISVVDR